jgi:hypothetical protein
MQKWFVRCAARDIIEFTVALEGNIKIITDNIIKSYIYRGADKSLARHTSRSILFDG